MNLFLQVWSNMTKNEAFFPLCFARMSAMLWWWKFGFMTVLCRYRHGPHTKSVRNFFFPLFILLACTNYFTATEEVRQFWLPLANDISTSTPNIYFSLKESTFFDRELWSKVLCCCFCSSWGGIKVFLRMVLTDLLWSFYGLIMVLCRLFMVLWQNIVWLDLYRLFSWS